MCFGVGYLVCDVRLMVIKLYINVLKLVKIKIFYLVVFGYFW